jgi:hypothetical protein
MIRFIEYRGITLCEANFLQIEVTNNVITGVIPNNYDTPPKRDHMAHDYGFYVDNQTAKKLVGQKYVPNEYDEDVTELMADEPNYKNKFYRG